MATGLKQKFHNGDLVHISKNLGSVMSHFTSDVDAIVSHSYHDAYGGGNRKDYSLILKEEGSCSWYEEHQLTLVEKGRYDLLEEWDDTDDDDDEGEW